MDRLTRRTFIGTAASAVGASLVSAQQKPAGPNDAINIGLIGCGGRGQYHIDIWKRLPQARFVAVCDVSAA